jgi:hypothetical protein
MKKKLQCYIFNYLPNIVLYALQGENYNGTNTLTKLKIEFSD